tara:strand:- start:1212 stop:1769 length:558 start_codon:yes stop_codon:yes gene_type:complete
MQIYERFFSIFIILIYKLDTFIMNKIISNKYLYVGLISGTLVLSLIVYGILLFISSDIEGEWTYVPNKETIGSHEQLRYTAESINELKSDLSREVFDNIIYKFKDENLYINENLIAKWSRNDHIIKFSSPIDPSILKEESPSLSTWDFSQKSDWVLSFNNNKTIMQMTNLNDSSEVLTFKKNNKR